MTTMDSLDDVCAVNVEKKPKLDQKQQSTFHYPQVVAQTKLN